LSYPDRRRKKSRPESMKRIILINLGLDNGDKEIFLKEKKYLPAILFIFFS
jgi:hypothetical protein